MVEGSVINSDTPYETQPELVEIETYGIPFESNTCLRHSGIRSRSIFLRSIYYSVITIII